VRSDEGNDVRPNRLLGGQDRDGGKKGMKEVHLKRGLGRGPVEKEILSQTRKA